MHHINFVHIDVPKGDYIPTRPALKFCTLFLPNMFVMNQANVGVYCQA